MFWHKRSTQRIEDLEEGLRKANARIEAVEFEWLNTQHKLKSIVGRIAKQQAREDEVSAAASGGHVPMIVNGTAVPTAPLTPRQQLIQRQIEEIRKAKAG